MRVALSRAIVYQRASHMSRRLPQDSCRASRLAARQGQRFAQTCRPTELPPRASRRGGGVASSAPTAASAVGQSHSARQSAHRRGCGGPAHGSPALAATGLPLHSAGRHMQDPFRQKRFGARLDRPCSAYATGGSFQPRLPPPSRHGHLRSGCHHSACLYIEQSNAPASRYSAHSSGRFLAIILVSHVRGQPAVLLTRTASETDYSFTAGSRARDASDGGCYVNAASTFLKLDANIPASLSERCVGYFAAPRLKNGTPGECCRPSDSVAYLDALARSSLTPPRCCSPPPSTVRAVLIGWVAESDIHNFDFLSNYVDHADTKLFRISQRSRRWRVVGQDDDRHVIESVHRLLTRHVDLSRLPPTL
jgi:hypothetical protein